MSETKLIPPYPKLAEDECEWVHAKLPKDLFNYFFLHVLTGQHGCRQTLIQLFFKKLYEQCVTDGIRAEWDPGNEQRVAGLLERLNFIDVSAADNRKPSAPVVGPERSVRSGRAHQPALVSPKQPSTGDRERAGTPRARSKASHNRDLPTNP